MMKEAIAQVMGGQDLSRDEARSVMNLIMHGNATPAQIAGLLVALINKGEKTQEVAGFVTAMRNNAVNIKVKDERAIDGCGTGGDSKHSFNISTVAAIVASAAGATVAKHGNRSVSSRCGSADLLEAAGGDIDPGPEPVATAIDQLGFGFLFAPRFHPAMKHAAIPRRELGLRTVFNLLGPMTNPAGVRRQVIGVYANSVMRLMIEVLQATGSEHVIVAHSRDGFDEFSISATTDYLELKDERIVEYSISPVDVGLGVSNAQAVGGGDVAENLRILNSVLDGEKGACRDAVLLNAGAMIYVADKAGSIRHGVCLAAAAIDNGSARERLGGWVMSGKE